MAVAKMSDEERVGRRICRRFGWKAWTVRSSRKCPDEMTILQFRQAENAKASPIWYWGKDCADAWRDAWWDPACPFWAAIFDGFPPVRPPAYLAWRNEKRRRSPAEIELAMAAEGC